MSEKEFMAMLEMMSERIAAAETSKDDLDVARLQVAVAARALLREAI